jgi:hypothetical protein
MEYNFVKAMCHPKLPNLTGWYLKVHREEFKLLLKLHKSLTTRLFISTQRDPHNYDSETKQYKDMYETILHPIALGAKWLIGVERHLLSNDYILFNSRCGWMAFDEKMALEEQIKDKCVFPKDTDNKNDAMNDMYRIERITIKRWPDAKHWYLISNQNRVFVPEKHVHLEDAMKTARQYVTEDKIKVDETKEMSNRGD